MNIHQLSVNHDERQDRLLLRLNTQDQQEFRFWLTRRMTLRLMPAIEQSAVRLEAVQPGVAVTDATPFENRATQWPLGAEPMLITDAHLTIKPSGALEIAFEDKSDPAQARACQLNLQVSLVHGLLHLIQQASEKAEWGVVGSAAKATDTGPVTPSLELPRYAH